MKKILASLVLLLATQVSAETFNRFGASTGVLKGSATSYQTTPAVSSDIISLWSGTCNASNFLRADGSCAAALSGIVPVGNGGTGAATLTGVLKGNGTSAFTAAASSDVISLWSGTCNSTTFLRADGACISAGGEGGIGSVTSVGLTVPAGFSVTGSPVTTSGSLGITTTLSGLLSGTGSGITGAVAADVTSEFSGTCNSTTFLRGDGSCQTVSTAANPTGVIGLTAVNGVATTFSRSDSAPALSQAIAPTWTAQHNFAQSHSSATLFAWSAQSDNPQVQWYETDAALNNKNWVLSAAAEQFRGYIANDNGTSAFNWLIVDRTGVTVDTINLTATDVQSNGQTIATETTTSVTPATTGCSSPPNATLHVSRAGEQVVMRINIPACTSNATTYTVPGGIPIGFRPTVAGQECQISAMDNGVVIGATLLVQVAGDIEIFTNTSSGAWTSSGTKDIGMRGTPTCSWTMN